MCDKESLKTLLKGGYLPIPKDLEVGTESKHTKLHASIESVEYSSTVVEMDINEYPTMKNRIDMITKNGIQRFLVFIYYILKLYYYDF